MATHDQTRSAFDPGKHYSGVRMQQGRVLTDDDFNEARRIDEEDQRRTRVQVIGAAGSPDDGFRVGSPTLAAGELDFTIDAGTFYLGGLKLEQEEPSSFRLQADWLLNPGVPAPAAERRDLVYLEAWEQPVSAVEDEELFEVALGGPDTASRERLMARVRVAAGVAAADCAAAWQEVSSAWAAQGRGQLGPDAQLVPDTLLTVGFSDGGNAEDLCSPEAGGGYLGAENQAIRVELVGAGHFTWGFDNGAPLYRARLSADGATVTLDSEPRDEAHHPLAGMIVEVLPWGAVLRNGEKLAEELEPGHLSRIAGSYDPDTRELTLTTPVPAGFGEAWQQRADAAALELARFGQVGPQEPYVFLRVWDRGDDTASLAAIPIAGAEIPLGTTGLTATFGGGDRRAGDFWILAARPETPDRVTPWELAVARPPHGVRRFVAPLAFLHWRPVGEGLVAEVEDCRKPFVPLTEIRSRGCCRFTVGDGEESHGDFTSLQQAIDRLPAEGGEICVLPGLYREHVVIANRRGVTLHGCGGRPRLEAPAGSLGPTLLIQDSSQVTVRGLALLAREGQTVELRSTPEAAGGLRGARRAPALLREITLEDLHLEARDRAALFGGGGQRITLRGCEVFLSALEQSLDSDPEVGREPGVFLAGDDLEIAGNSVAAESSDAFVRTPLGGIQIGGGSRRVEVRGNRVLRGTGNGLTLGSWHEVDSEVSGSLASLATHFTTRQLGPVHAGRLAVDPTGCIRPAVVFEPAPGFGPPGSFTAAEAAALEPVSDGDLYEVVIADNEIQDMGGSGISVARFFDPATRPILIGVRGLRVEGNRIRRCLRMGGGSEQPEPLRYRAAYGGIILADCERAVLRDNVIEELMPTQREPACGLFALVAQEIEITHNVIRSTARRFPSQGSPTPGLRGGIVLGLVLPATEPRVGSFAGRRLEDRPAGPPAARIHHNAVDATAGRALEMLALGPVEVSDNRFAAQGDEFHAREVLPGSTSQPPHGFTAAAAVSLGDRRKSPPPRRFRSFLDTFGGAAVSAVDLGLANDIFFYLLGYSTLKYSERMSFDLSDEKRQVFHRGPLLFADNQVHYDSLLPEGGSAMSAVTLLCLDDVAAADNQLSCDLPVPGFQRINLLALGTSLRAAGNRLAETFLSAVLSAVTFGLANDTAHNQGTHCFNISGLPPLSVTSPNRSILGWQSTDLCAAVSSPLLGG